MVYSRAMRHLIIVAAVSGCVGGKPGLTPEPAALTADRLQAGTYLGVLDEPVTLVDGRYEGEPFLPGSATRQVVKFVPGVMATGDLTGDGIDEAVVVLAHNSGGSGVFMHLAIVQDHGGNLENVATFNLGDRVKVIAVDIDDGTIVVDLVEHSPNDPMCCPTNNTHRKWLLQGNELIMVEPDDRMRATRITGHLVWGHESRSFAECGGDRQAWVINDSGDELVDVYNELTTTPYQPMFVEVRGEWTEAPTDGFGADFEKALRITELVRAENEGFGCRLELDDVLFIASGNEPFWRVHIREEGISLRSMDAPGEVELSAPRMSGQPPRVVFEAQGPESGITVLLERRRCIDTMSGARYAWAADIEVDGRHFEGCAAEGL
jgi:uncharacterized membrane protein